MAQDESNRLEVPTYFVRGRNALVARAEFGELYVDYYLHQASLGMQHPPFHDGIFKEALAALTLHLASRPRNETTAWTIHFQQPLLNVFVTGNNMTGTVVGQIFAEDVKDVGRNLFFLDLVKNGRPARRSSVEFEGLKPFRAVEHYYAQSEQRPARYFQFAEEDFVMVTAQPDCDLTWFESLTDEAVRQLESTEELALLEKRHYHWQCGCNDHRMMTVLAPVMKQDPDGLFGGEPSVRMRCPRCGVKFLITRESLEAFVAAR
ncbi:MAG: Hsp33 family molecular chaperone HslO [Verrucomicrobiales bacterium]